MTQSIEKIAEIASRYDAIVFDQWGVLHNGTAPYPGAPNAIAELTDVKTAVLSNSGKRAAPNRDRIESMGFDPQAFEIVMSSGEALWQDVAAGIIPEKAFLPVEATQGDAEKWCEGLSIQLTSRPEDAEAVLLMGLSDGSTLAEWEPDMAGWLDRGLTVYCSNPDRQSPRADRLVIQPGALAFRYRDLGGTAVFYGKPHLPIFRALESALGSGRYLMVGDSLEHDIAGAQNAGWDSLLIEGGLYADPFAQGDGDAVLDALVSEKACAHPTYRMGELR